MRDKELYGRILGVEAPWRVADVELNQQGEIVVHVEHDGPLTCPHCGQAARRYDSRHRWWRHLDTCQYRTVLARRRTAVSVPAARRQADRGAVERRPLAAGQVA